MLAVAAGAVDVNLDRRDGASPLKSGRRIQRSTLSQNQVVRGIQNESALPHLFGSITESKIRWWGLCVNPE